MATKDNLQAAFSGESQANRKYLAFAQQAERDGFSQVACLFRAAAEAETVHATAHLRVMGGIGSTLENLNNAVEGEGYEFKEMYPNFLTQARGGRFQTRRILLQECSGGGRSPLRFVFPRNESCSKRP